MSRHEKETPWSPVVVARRRQAAAVMSRHGMIPPAGGFPAPRGLRTPHELLLTSLTMLMREVVFGFML